MDNNKPQQGPQQGQQQQQPPHPNSPGWKVQKKGHTLEHDSHVHPVDPSQTGGPQPQK